MSKLSETVDREVGQDTENERVTYLKYINYGRQLAAEELAQSGSFTKEQLDQAKAEAAKDVAKHIFEELDKIEANVASLQADVEKNDEDATFEVIKAAHPSVAVLADVETLLKTVDEKHTRIMHDVKAPALKALKEKYL